MSINYSDEMTMREYNEKEEFVEELERLVACYQIASRDDKNVVWAALNKYMASLSLI